MITKILTNKTEWEEIIDEVSPTAVFQRWDWGDVQQISGSSVLRFGYYDHGSLIGVAQTVLVRAKRGNFLHIRHGPIIKKWDTAHVGAIVSHLKTIGNANKCVCIRMSPCIEENAKHEALIKHIGGLPAAIHAMDAEHSWVLDITIPEEELLVHMRKTTRYEIRKAAKLGVSIEKTMDSKSLAHFFRLYDATSKRQGFVEHQHIKEEFSVFSKKNAAVHILGAFQGKPIASAIILFVGNEAIYHHGASETSSIPASYLVQWEAIREAKKRGMNVYNFWGIAPTDNPRHPWHGLTQFKQGFGGSTRTYMHAFDIPLSWRYWLFRGIEWIRKHSKGY
jgi:peptidoglycan pentaglycine glycine transferase (the first glycine)